MIKKYMKFLKYNFKNNCNELKNYFKDLYVSFKLIYKFVNRYKSKGQMRDAFLYIAICAIIGFVICFEAFIYGFLFMIVFFGVILSITNTYWDMKGYRNVKDE